MMKNISYFNASERPLTDIKIANVFSLSSASLKYEFQSLNALQTNFITEANTMNPDQTAPKGAV